MTFPSAFLIFSCFCHLITDGTGTITWYEPSPVETTADPSDIRTINIELINASTNKQLSWNFSLTADLNPVQSVGIFLGVTQIVNIVPVFNIAEVVAGFEDRFNFTWINSQRVTLIIFKVTKDVAGDFACQVTTLGGGTKTWKRIFRVTVLLPAKITNISENQTVTEGYAELHLNSSATGESVLNITWTRLFDSSVVTMPLINIRMHDGGGYRCNADNGVGLPGFKDVFINVHYPPNIASISLNQTVDEGGVVLLNCIADGNPKPNITWRRLSDNSIVIMPLTITGKQDEGGYRCTADNGIGNAATSDVFIAVRFSAKVTAISGNQTVTEGYSELHLNCSATGEPMPNITWTRLCDRTDVSMPLVNIRRQDGGGYRCTANNGVGWLAFKDVYISVQYPPNITSISLNQTVDEGDVVLLNCTADGNPKPNITWMRLSDNSIVRMPLTITGKQDEGGYRCIVDNGIGNAAFSDAFITVRHPPNVTSISLNQTVDEGDVVLLNCTADGNPQPNITWTRLSDNSIVNRTLTITGKQDEGGYRCTAFNGIGNAAFSDVFITVQYGTGSITWYEPHPVETTADPSDIRIINIELINASTNKQLSWNFSLTADLNPLQSVGVYLGVTQIVNIVPFLNVAQIIQGFEDRFNFTWINSQRVTLIIFKVTKDVAGDFACQVNTVGGGSKIWKRTIRVTVAVPAKIMSISGNQTVIEGHAELHLNCSATGEPAPNVTWTRLFDSSVVTMPLMNIRRQDEGGYRCIANNGVRSPASKDAFINVHYSPNITSISLHQTVDEGDVVLLTCTADGNPEPNITWTRLSDNSIVNMPLTITGKLDEGGYRCTADNGIGNVVTSHVFITVHSYHPINTVLSTNLPNNTVNLNETFTLLCNADANPAASYRLYREQESLEEQNNGTYLTFGSTRTKQVAYRCVPFNSFGDGPSKMINVTVYYNPVSVRLVANATENKNCCDSLIVNFTCEASQSNPPVESYQLFKSQEIVDTRSRGTWIENISSKGGHIYSCRALHSLGSVTSADIIVTFNVPVQVYVHDKSGSVTIREGASLSLKCNASGYPQPTVTWSKLNANELIISSQWINFTNISKEATGEYICNANNTCGEQWSSVRTIDVQYAAEVTGRGGNYSVPEGSSKRFSCPVDGNPEPNITWYKGSDVTEPGISNAKQLEATETGCYTCSASNLLGTPVSITQCLTFVLEEPTSATPTPTGKPTKQVYADLTIMEDFLSEYRDLNNQVSKQLVDSFVSEMNEIYQNDDKYFRTEVTGLRRGSVIVSFTMYFKIAVTPSQGISKLEADISDGTFGTYQVGNLTLLSPGTSTFTSTTPGTSQSTEFQCACDRTLLVIIGVLVSIIIVLILVIAWQHRKLGIARKKRPYKVAEDKDRRIYDNEVAMEELNPTNDPPSSSNQQRRIPIEPAYMPLQGTTHYEVGQKSSNNSPQNVEYAPLDIRTRSWEVTREDVKVEKIIGKGAFGQVAKGTAKNLPFHSGTKTVAVKMLKANAPESDKRDLKSELDLMKTLKPHPHVIKLLGCVTETDPLLVLIEYVPYGDLLGYLRKSRGLNDTYYKDPDIKPQTSLTSQQLMKFAWQIADGMNYLSLRKIIHRDLAARNVLVGETETCKVTDFGMARDVQQESIYERKTRGRLPVKWTAYESLLYGKYTTKSDAWSYGIVLYEIFTVGGSPYPRMDGKKIASFLQQGYRMPKPQHVDNDLYQIMMNCWQNEPEARPSFADLTQQLKGMEKQHKRLLNMHIYDNELYANLEDLNA